MFLSPNRSLSDGFSTSLLLVMDCLPEQLSQQERVVVLVEELELL